MMMIYFRVTPTHPFAHCHFLVQVLEINIFLLVRPF